METTNYEQLGRRIGALVDTKNAAYGSSFAKAGEFLRLLYPAGISPAQMTDALLLVRIFDKQMRIATDGDAFGESPYDDIAGYGLLGSRLHEERRSPVSTFIDAASMLAAMEKIHSKYEHEIEAHFRAERETQECGTARADVDGESMEPNDSAANAASAPTTPNAGANSETSSKPPSTPESRPGSESMDAPAPNAQETASVDRDDLAKPDTADDLVERVRDRNQIVQCGICTEMSRAEWMSNSWGGECFYFCSRACRAHFHLLARQLPRRPA